MSSIINQLKCFLSFHDWQHTIRMLSGVADSNYSDIRDFQTEVRYCKICGRTEVKGRSSKHWTRLESY